jgi:hypothetical protein
MNFRDERFHQWMHRLQNDRHPDTGAVDARAVVRSGVLLRGTMVVHRHGSIVARHCMHRGSAVYHRRHDVAGPVHGARLQQSRLPDDQGEPGREDDRKRTEPGGATLVHQTLPWPPVGGCDGIGRKVPTDERYIEAGGYSCRENSDSHGLS